MLSKRIAILLAGLVALLLVHAYYPRVEMWLVARKHLAKYEKPLPGNNSISNLEVKLRPDGKWGLKFDYFYTGEPSAVSVMLDHLVDRERDGPMMPFMRPSTRPNIESRDTSRWARWMAFGCATTCGWGWKRRRPGRG
jgi:hypothetical protein